MNNLRCSRLAKLRTVLDTVVVDHGKWDEGTASEYQEESLYGDHEKNQ